MLPQCEICGSQEARYVCGRCGRQVCVRDFRSGSSLCTSCEPASRPQMMERSAAASFGLSRMLFVGLVMILAGMILMMLASFTQSGGTSGGAVILIGPIPIILGSGPDSALLVLLGLVMTVLMVLFFLFANRRRR